MKTKKHQLIPIMKTNLKEPTNRWRHLTNTALPYFLVTWHWLNQISHVTSADRVYHFMVHIWNQLQRWVNKQENWSFLQRNEQYQLLRWVESLVRPHKITNFKEDWQDGIILCALIEGLAPGVCPRHDLLHPRQEILNLELGFRLAEMHLGMISDLTASEILNMEEGIDKKLQQFVARLRSSSQVHSSSLCRLAVGKDRCATSEVSPKSPPTCLAKGMGLMMGNKGRKACFNIYLQTSECMDIIIEIEGPDGDYCTERITLRSPRKKETLGEGFRQSLTSGRAINIFLEYEMFSKKIAVTYIPPSTGRYKLSIISRGQHIFGSPFTVIVDEESSLPHHKSNSFLQSGLPRQDSEDSLFDSSSISKTIIKLEEPPHGKTIKRKLLRSIVFRQYANIILQPDEPLPMDIRAWTALSANAGISIHESSNDDVDGGTMEQSQLAAMITNDENVCTTQGNEIAQNGRETQLENDSDYVACSDAETVDILDVECQKTATLFQEMDDAVNYSSKESLPEINTPVMPKICITYSDPHKNSGCDIPRNNVDECQMVKNKADDTAITNNDEHSCIKSLPNLPSSSGTILDSTNRSSKELLKISRQKIKPMNELNIEIVNLNAGRKNNNLSSQNSAENWSKPIVTCDSIFCQPSCRSENTDINGRQVSTRVSENLIKDWANLWNSEGESIVKTRLKEWENTVRTLQGDDSN